MWGTELMPKWPSADLPKQPTSFLSCTITVVMCGDGRLSHANTSTLIVHPTFQIWRRRVRDHRQNNDGRRVFHVAVKNLQCNIGRQSRQLVQLYVHTTCKNHNRKSCIDMPGGRWTENNARHTASMHAWESFC